MPTPLSHDDLLARRLRLPGCPHDIWVHALAHPHFKIRGLLACLPQTPRDILEKLAAIEHDLDILRTLTIHPHLPAKALSHLADHPDDDIAGGAAAHPALTSATRQTLVHRAQHGALPIAKGLAKNPSSSGHLLNTLAQCYDSDTIRSCIASHPAVWPSTLTRLARLGSHITKAAIASNPATPGPLLSTLAVERLELNVALNPSARAKTLHRLAASINPYVRRAIAAHPHTTTATLSRLAHDPVLHVRQAVRDHPTTPLPIRTRLALELGHS